MILYKNSLGLLHDPLFLLNVLGQIISEMWRLTCFSPICCVLVLTVWAEISLLGWPLPAVSELLCSGSDVSSVYKAELEIMEVITLQKHAQVMWARLLILTELLLAVH